MMATAKLEVPEMNTSLPWVSHLNRGMQLLVDQYGLAPGLVSQHGGSVEQTLSAVVDDESLLQGSTTPNQPWGWAPFLESPALTVGALTVFEQENIPMHDHPGSIGLLLVLRGRVRIQSYDPLGDAAVNDASTRELHQTDDRMLGEGQATLFGAHKNNIHSLQAVGGDCILFDVLFSPYQPGLRSYYFPTTQVSTDGRVQVSRLNKATLAIARR